MKKLILLTFIVSVPASAVFFQNCRESSLESCVNSNFSNLASDIGARRFRHCSKGRDTQELFASCINQNFMTAQHEMEEVYFPRFCRLANGKISSSFLSCVNQNFKEIQKTLRKF